MSQPKIPILNPHRPKRHLFSLRVKFILALTVLIGTVMVSVTWMVLNQVRQTLVRQVVERGESQVRSLAFNVVDPILSVVAATEKSEEGLIALMQFTNDAVSSDSAGSGTALVTGIGMPPWQQALFDALDNANRMVQESLWPSQSVKGGDVEYAVVVDNTSHLIGLRTMKSATNEDLQRAVSREAYPLPAGVKNFTDIEKSDGRVSAQSYQGTDGRTYYHIMAPVLTQIIEEGQEKKVHIGTVHLGMNETSITRVERTVAVTIILITAAALAIGIVFMAFFVAFLVKPIGLLVKGVGAIAGGNLDQQILLKRHDELGDLTDAFNEMAKSLREKEMLKGAFSKYVTKSVVDRIMSSEGGGLKLGGEKKVLSVFFSDIRGFTPMSEQLEPEQIVHLLNEYFTEMVKIIFKYEGTLDKFMGDAIMAIFGAPVDLPDHAERSVLAAIDMSQKMKELQAKWRMEGKKDVNIGIGINTGEVVVGNLGSLERMEYTAIGDNVNLAQRLESVAEKGQILISAGTYERVKHKVEARMLDPIKLKGKAEKVIAYEVIGVRAS